MSIIKTYAYKGITIDAVQITTRRMSEADRTALNAWLDKHNVNVIIETGYYIGTNILVEVEGPISNGLEYSFDMRPGDWLAHDGEIFFHITNDVFRKHYREVNDEEDTVVYATGGVLNSTTGIDMYQFIPPAWRTHKPVDGLISIDKHPPVHLGLGEWHDHPKPRKRRGGATMKASYLDEAEAINSDLRTRHRAKGLATATCPYPHPKIVTGGKKAQTIKQALDAAELKQQAKETNQETYDRHLKLLDTDGHADQCDYCKDTTRNMVPPAHNKALADAVDQQLADMARRRGYAHLHMDRDGKVTPARRLREELEQQWHPTHTTKATPRKRTAAERTAEWRAPLEVLAMYYNQFPPTVKAEKGETDRRLHDVPGSGRIRLHGGITVDTEDGARVYVHAKELTRHSNGDIKITGPRFTVEYTAEAYISCNYLNAYGAIRTINSPAPGRKETEGMKVKVNTEELAKVQAALNAMRARREDVTKAREAAEKEREAVDQGVFDAYRDNLRSCLDVIRQLTDGDSTIQALVRQANNNLDGMHRTTPTPTTGPEATND